MWKEWKMKNWQRLRWGDCVKRVLERVGGELQQKIDGDYADREWRERERERQVRKEKDDNNLTLTPDNRDAKRRTTIVPLPRLLLLCCQQK